MPPKVNVPDSAPRLEHASLSKWRMVGGVDLIWTPKRHVLKEVGLRAHNYFTILDASITLFRSITMFCGTHGIPQNIP